ncbi:MAG: hypothetical protein KDI17_13210 [Halioglobus sp.]|nr:hypothetical protein [Halioglobus sp.]
MPEQAESQRNDEHPGALNQDWTIPAVLEEAWKLQNGFKAIYWSALAVLLIVNLLLSGVAELLGDGSDAVDFIRQLITAVITYPLMVGLMMIAIKHSAGLPTSASMVFDYYPSTIPIFLTYLLMAVLIGVGFFLLVVPGIYLMFAYMLALPLLVDRQLGIWQALETSRKAITPCWFRVFGLSVVTAVIVVVSAIPLGIGLIWTLPFMGLVMGILYRNIVGAPAVDTAPG